jgi:hypothetical protein
MSSRARAIPARNSWLKATIVHAGPDSGAATSSCSSIRTDLLVTAEIVESADLRATPFEFERATRVEAALSILEGKLKIVILNRLFACPTWRFSELERAAPAFHNVCFRDSFVFLRSVSW